MSKPYYGGMRHIHTLAGIFDQARGEIANLKDESEVEKVLECIARVKAVRKQPQDAVGRPDSILRHVGKFSFNDGELKELLDIVISERGDRND